MNSNILLRKYKATIAYIITTVVVNILYSHLPFFLLLGYEVSPGDFIVGSIYVMRDFAQREIGHKVIFAMLVGAIISFILAAHNVALASVAAFVVGESIDWLIFTITKKPLSQRLLWSSMLSVPIDSYVFLSVFGHLNWVEYGALTATKFLGVLVIWYIWRRQDLKMNTQRKLAQAID